MHKVIWTCDVIAPSRSHAMVGESACARPVMVLGWSHKYLEVMRLFGQEDMVMDHADLNLDAMDDRVNALLSDARQRRQRIAEALPRVQDGSRVQLDYLGRFLADPA